MATSYALDFLELDPELSFNRQYFEGDPVRYAPELLLEILLAQVTLEELHARFPEVGVLVWMSREGWLKLHRFADGHTMRQSAGARPSSGFYALTPRLLGEEDPLEIWDEYLDDED